MLINELVIANYAVDACWSEEAISSQLEVIVYMSIGPAGWDILKLPLCISLWEKNLV